MYRKYYGLKEKPIEITVDTRFLYLSETHREALAHLVYAVQERKGFAVAMGGEAGPERPPSSRPCWPGSSWERFGIRP